MFYWSKMRKIVWNYNRAASHNEGYRTSSEKVSTGLIKKGIDIEYYDDSLPLGISNLISQASDIPQLVENYDDYIIINNTLPSDYRRVNGYNIGFTYWETTKLPKDWVVKMNTMDEIWTASDFMRRVFIHSGVTVPVLSFSLGVDDLLYNPKLRRARNPFTFLSIGSPSSRKNSQMAVDAFIKCFGTDDQYKLIYKSMGPPDARLNKGTSDMKPIYGHPNIEVIEEDLSNEDLAKLYDRADCLVYPTSGEGWGWFPYQAIAKAIPTICPPSTSCEEYAHLLIPLRFDWSSENLFGLYSGNGEWMKPNFNDLCGKMLDVACNYELYADTTYRNVVRDFKFMTWDYAIEGYYNRICQILNQ